MMFTSAVSNNQSSGTGSTGSRDPTAGSDGQHTFNHFWCRSFGYFRTGSPDL